LFDGITRHSPEGLWFKRYAEAHGFAAAVAWRDSGRELPDLPPGDTGDAYMSAPAEGQPARSQWASDVAGRRKAPPAKKTTRRRP
jgi:enoyl-CoA hydratase